MKANRFNTTPGKDSIRGMHPDIIISDTIEDINENEFSFLHYTGPAAKWVDSFLLFTVNLN